MREATKTASTAAGLREEEIFQETIAAAGEGPPGDRVASGLEAAIAAAEADPAGARAALSALRADHRALARLELCLDGGASRATFALGGAIQLALAELSAPQPDLRARRPELERWLEGGW